jgi:integrase
MNIKRNIIFSPESRKKNGSLITGNIPIRMRVIYSGQRIDFSTGYRIDADKWDADKQRVRNGCTNKLKQTASEINTDLLKYYTNIQNIFKEYEVQENIPSPEQIRLAFASKIKKRKEDTETVDEDMKEEISFMQLLDEFVKECGTQNNWTVGTCDRFVTVKNHLLDFNAPLSLEAIDESLLNTYINFLKDKGLRNTTITKEIKLLKWFLRWTVKKGYNTNTSFSTFLPKLKTTQKKVIFLTWQELTQLKEYEIPKSKNYLERVRDIFLFCCFTGLRYSDVFNLKRSDIKNNHIEITTVKTADSLIIELNNHSKTILDKYKNIPFEKDKALPVISNHRMNVYIKELAELAGINEPVRETYYKGSNRVDEVLPKYALLGTHSGRRTFICNALSLGIPAQVVMKWTGHSDYTAMKPYIEIADHIKANEMGKFNRL